MPDALRNLLKRLSGGRFDRNVIITDWCVRSATWVTHHEVDVAMLEGFAVAPSLLEVDPRQLCRAHLIVVGVLIIADHVCVNKRLPIDGSQLLTLQIH